MTDDQPAHMWPYWRDKKGHEEALDDYYPNVSSQPNAVWLAKEQLKQAKRELDRCFSELAGEEEQAND